MNTGGRCYADNRVPYSEDCHRQIYHFVNMHIISKSKSDLFRTTEIGPSINFFCCSNTYKLIDFVSRSDRNMAIVEVELLRPTYGSAYAISRQDRCKISWLLTSLQSKRELPHKFVGKRYLHSERLILFRRGPWSGDGSCMFEASGVYDGTVGRCKALHKYGKVDVAGT